VPIATGVQESARGKSVKGSLIAGVVEDLHRLIERGVLDRDELEARLEPADLAQVDDKILVGAWYPVGAMGRILDLVWEEEAQRRPESLRERGRRAATQLAESGLYRQVQASRSRQGQEFGRMLTSLAGAMFNFMRWSYESDDGGRTSRIVVVEATGWPEVLRIATEGFIETLVAAAGGRAVRVTSERPTPDRVVFDVRVTG
jgi:hypothetical protein